MPEVPQQIDQADVSVNPQNVITVLRRKLNEAQIESSMWEAAYAEMKARADSLEASR